jgi:tRNA-splicing ligase RtcB
VEKRFRYRQKNVRDITVDDGLVRVWDTTGDLDRQGILQAFLPLLRTCFVSPYIALMRRAIEVVALHSRSLQEAGTETVAERMLDVAHNYVAQETHLGETYYVHRKGAIRALDGETVMIPGSMGTTSYIAEGRGNDFAFCSCSHGAGRVMSRHAASRSISDKRFTESMASVEHEGDTRLKDESPLA